MVSPQADRPSMAINATAISFDFEVMTRSPLVYRWPHLVRPDEIRAPEADGTKATQGRSCGPAYRQMSGGNSRPPLQPIKPLLLRSWLKRVSSATSARLL